MLSRSSSLVAVFYLTDRNHAQQLSEHENTKKKKAFIFSSHNLLLEKLNCKPSPLSFQFPFQDLIPLTLDHIVIMLSRSFSLLSH